MNISSGSSIDPIDNVSKLGFRVSASAALLERSASIDELADILKRRNIRTIYYFHADHYEPWSLGLNERTAAGVERFGEMSLASPFARRMSLFYSAYVPYSLDVSENQRAVGRRVAGDCVFFNIRTDKQEELARNAFRPLFEPGAHELHLHVHHEFWTRNESHFDHAVSKWVNANSTAAMDEKRLDLFLTLCREVISRELGRPFNRWAFVHGNWSLAASDPLICQIENELGAIMRHGGFGDFSFPAGRAHCDPKLQLPFTCRPIDGKRPYDDPASDPLPLAAGSGVLSSDRFFIWNSPIKAQYSSLDYYWEPNRELFKQSDRVLSEWLGNSVAFGPDLYIKTHAHSMKWEYEVFKPDSQIPHLYPDVVNIFEELLRVCDKAGVEFRLTTVNEVMANLEALDTGRAVDATSVKPTFGPVSEVDFGASDKAAQVPQTPAAAMAQKQPERELLPVEPGSFNEELVALHRQWLAGEGETFSGDDLYVSKIARRASLETYESAVGLAIARDFEQESTSVVEVGGGYGALAFLLGRHGFAVQSFEGDRRRVAAATWHNKQYSERYPGLANRIRFVPGFFPEALKPEAALPGVKRLCIATNVTCTYTARNQDMILDQFAICDELILDLGRFGVSRNSQIERDALRDRIQDRGFEAVDRLYFAAPYEYWRFRKKKVSDGLVRHESESPAIGGHNACSAFPVRDGQGVLYSVFGDRRLPECPVCGATSTRQIWRIPMSVLKEPVSPVGNYHSQFPTLQVPADVHCFDFCDECQSVYLNPVDGNRKEHYRSDEQCIGSMRGDGAWEGYERSFDRFAKWLPENASVMIDAACGIGQYLEVARRRAPGRWQRLIGLELSERYVRHMRDGNLEAHVLDLDTQPFDDVVAPGSVDVIFFCDAFQYVERPMVVLRKLLATLRPGGRLFFTAQRYGRDVQAAVRPGDPIYVGQAFLEQLSGKLGCQVADISTTTMQYFVVLEK